MRRSPLLLLALCATSLLLLSCTTALADEMIEVETDAMPPVPPPRAPGNPAPKTAEPVQLRREDFCKACYSVVEEFHKWTVRNFNEPASRRNTTMSRSELVEWFCRTGPFEHWKPNLVWGCIKTVQDHHDEVLAPFLGTHVSHEYTTLASVFNHRVASCALPSVDACDAWQPEGRSKTDCATCDRLARDLHWSLSRELKVNKTIVEKTLGVICMEVGMRHERPMEIEAFCHEHVDEHWVSLNKALVRIFNDVRMPSEREKIAAIKRRFCGGLTEVCEEEAKADKEERKRRKDEEKAARLRAREEKKAASAGAASAAAAGTGAPAAAGAAAGGKKEKDEL